MTLQIVIPCAGEGRRFREAGYLIPKPFMDVAGKSMIARVMESLTPSQPHTFQLLDRALVGTTQGAVDTLLKADIDPAEPVLVANCDQLFLGYIDNFLEAAADSKVTVMTFESANPHHSYVTYAPLTNVIEAIEEKNPISCHAVVGVYYFASGRLLTRYAMDTLSYGNRYNGEFYVSEMLKLMLKDDVPVEGYPVNRSEVAMLGTPEELSAYLETL